MYSVDKTRSEVSYDLGLRQFFLSVFNNMTVGLTISAIIAFVVGHNVELLQLFFAGPQKWLVMLSPLVMVLVISFQIERMSFVAARLWFYAFAAVMGISLASIFVVYKLASIVMVFFATITLFGIMSILGYTTKQDLSKYGPILFATLITVIIVSLINLFMQSSGLTILLSIVSVFLFAGLTAYDIQMLVGIYNSTDGEDREKLGILGALNLYLDFINIFLSLLRLLGEKD